MSRIDAREGDLIEPGQVIVRVDTGELEAELTKSRAKIAEAEESTTEVTAQIASQESELLLARQQIARAEKRLGSKTITRDEYEEKESRCGCQSCVWKPSTHAAVSWLLG